MQKHHKIIEVVLILLKMKVLKCDILSDAMEEPICIPQRYMKGTSSSHQDIPPENYIFPYRAILLHHQ